MCKILAIAGIKKEHSGTVKQIIQKMAEIISRTDNDGFGYAAVTPEGKIFGEKWLLASNVLKELPSIDVGYSKIEAILGQRSKFKVVPSLGAHESFGSVDFDNAAAVIFHGRKKTVGDVSLTNAHPFYEVGIDSQPDTAIIHNGSITNHLQLTKKYSTCDSEVILHEYTKNYMWYNPETGIKDMAETLKGEYAVGALSSIEYEEGEVIPYLDIFKSNKDLYAGYIKEIDAIIYTTADYNLIELGHALSLTITAISEVPDGVLIRLNAVTGELLDNHIEFPKSSYSVYTNNYHHSKTPVVQPKVHIVDDYKNIYSQKYHELPKELTPEEKEYLEELEANPNVDFKALELVKRVINL